MRAWYSREQRALDKALKAGVEVKRAESASGELLACWAVESASTYGRWYEVRLFDGRFTCTCQGGALPMCLHRAAVMHSLSTLTLDPPKCRACRHVHIPGVCSRRCQACKDQRGVRLFKDAPVEIARPADEYVRLYGDGE